MDIEEEIQEVLWKEIKKVNKTMPPYKYIRELKDLYDETQRYSVILPPRRKDPYELDKIS